MKTRTIRVPVKTTIKVKAGGHTRTITKTNRVSVRVPSK